MCEVSDYEADLFTSVNNHLANNFCTLLGATGDTFVLIYDINFIIDIKKRTFVIFIDLLH